ncbi:hypothetical protein LZ686_00530 [Paracoccus sp. NFXS7]|uniref:hypothetical protein n=1 Tax=Paracoccus sp. NFXS7 TaxID=2908653 RepID=UPI0032E04A1D
MADNEKLDLIDGDEVRLIYRGNGSYSVQLMRQPRSGTNVTLLNGARSAPVADVLDYLKQAL